jgi:flagellar motor protein MotB
MKPVAAVAAGALLLGSCNGDPFALNLQKVDETSAQAPATIELSAPQLYSRERLINDRATEEDYLETLMKASVDIQFTPALQRDLATVSSLFLSIAATFNPTRGAQVSRAEDENQLQSEINQTKLQTALAKAQQELKAQQAQEPKVPDNTNTTDTVKEEQEDKKPSTVADTTKQLEALQKALDQVSAAVQTLSATSKTNAGLSDVKATPQELFEDRQAYRSQLRSALEQSRLDDRHDLNGNALYRLQYHATVLPGKVKNRYGVARVKILPRDPSNREIYYLYRDWLAAITAELNQPNEAEARIALERYAALGSATGMFEVTKMSFGNCAAVVETATCHIFPVALPFRLVAEKDDLLKDSLAWSARFDALQSLYNTLRVSATTPPEVKAILQQKPDAQRPDEMGDCSRWSSAEMLSDLLKKAGVSAPTEFPDINLAEMVSHAQKVIALQQIVGLALTKAHYDGSISRSADAANEDFAFTIGVLQEWSYASFSFFDLVDLNSRGNGCKDYLRPGFTPQNFWNAVKGKSTMVDSFAYSTTPSVLAQRVSTIANATEALQIIASISAVLPTAGANIDAAGNYMHSATGKVQALESVPLVIGFSAGGAPREPSAAEQSDVAQMKQAAAGADQESENNTEFGWVFGPKAVVNPSTSTIELRQVPLNEEVTADVSVPGWWPSLRLEVKTAWAKNFYDGMIGDDSEEKVTTRVIEVPLSGTRQRFDSLTEFISNAVWGVQPTPIKITAVEPTVIPACGTASVIIRGPNLWRGGEVYLNGRKADGAIHVLPDMMGIVANFNLDPTVAELANPASLQVFTQVGTDSEPLTLDSSGCNLGLSDGGGVAVTGAKSRALFESQTMEVNAAAEWPDASKLSVRLFPEGDEDSKAAIEIPDVLRSGSTLYFTVLKPPAPATGLPNGALFEAAVLYSDAGQKRKIATVKSLYLYKSKADADVTIGAGVAPATVLKADLDAGAAVKVTVKLKFPEKFQAANPTVASKGLWLVLKDPLEQDVQSAQITSLPSDEATRDKVFSFDLDKDMARKLITDAGVAIKFKLTVGTGADAVEIAVPATPVLTLKTK